MGSSSGRSSPTSPLLLPGHSPVLRVASAADPNEIPASASDKCVGEHGYGFAQSSSWLERFPMTEANPVAGPDELLAENRA